MDFIKELFKLGNKQEDNKDRDNRSPGYIFQRAARFLNQGIHFLKLKIDQGTTNINYGVQKKAKKGAPNKIRAFENCTTDVKLNGKPLFESKSSLCELNEDGRLLILLSEVYLFIIEEDKFQYYFEIFDENMQILYRRPIQKDLNYYFDDADSYFKWVDIRPRTEDIVVYACEIPIRLANHFKIIFCQCMYEASNQRYIAEELGRKEDQYNGTNRAIRFEDSKNQEDEGDLEMDIEDTYTGFEDASTALYTGQTLSLSYIPQRLVASAVVENDDDNSFYYANTPTKKLKLDQQEGKILTYSDYKAIEDLRPGTFEGDNQPKMTKNPQRTTRRSGFGENSLVPSFDNDRSRNNSPSVNKTISEMISSASAASKYTCITSPNTKESFATGSEKGEIRLYCKPGQKARTLISGFGAPILSLDATPDGIWLLAATKPCLILIQTIINGRNGYKKSITKELISQYKLTVPIQDMKKYRLTEINFEHAEFIYDHNGKGTLIIGYAGNFSISWDMKNVLEGQTENYQVKRIRYQLSGIAASHGLKEVD